MAQVEQIFVIVISGGLPSWQTPAGGGGADGNWVFFNGSGIRLATTTNQVLIGASSTTTLNIFETIGSGYFSGSLGIGTTTPGTLLSPDANNTTDEESLTPKIFKQLLYYHRGRLPLDLKNIAIRLIVSLFFTQII